MPGINAALAKGVTFAASDDLGNSALHIAALNGNLQLVEVLPPPCAC